MEAFPFTETEWASLKENIRCLVNATFARDDALHALLMAALAGQLRELRNRYGRHPVLLETEADFADETSERLTLYREAKRISLEEGLPILSICLSLARLLLNEAQPQAAQSELLDCEKELVDVDERDVLHWMYAECYREIHGPNA
jgi:hypothetical protein